LIGSCPAKAHAITTVYSPALTTRVDAGDAASRRHLSADHHLTGSDVTSAFLIFCHGLTVLSPQIRDILEQQRDTTIKVHLIVNGDGHSAGHTTFIPSHTLFAKTHAKAQEGRIIPGNADLVLLEAFKLLPIYDRYLVMEYDVFYNGDLEMLVSHIFSSYPDHDFVSTFIRPYKGNERWMWWSSLRRGRAGPTHAVRTYAFMQLALYSYVALRALSDAVEDGWAGHHEVLHATLFRSLDLKIGTFEQGPLLRFDATTFAAVGPCALKGEGFLHHPVKLSV
jgi:hypothetical protein